MPRPDPLQRLADDIRAHVLTQPDPEAIAAATAVELATMRERPATFDVSPEAFRRTHAAVNRRLAP